MTDSFEPDEPLAAAVRALQQPVAVAPGLIERARRRHRRERFELAGGTAVVIAALLLVVLHRSPGTTVRFTFTAPSVQSVSLVGDFTDWRTDRLPLVRGDSGQWETTVKLRPGEYRFAYLVNHDQWRADGNAPSAPDDFGRPTSMLTVTGN